jgi:glycosyltransferase involved in cell wall biosynthesis/GT2 family glycosyltransferase
VVAKRLKALRRRAPDWLWSSHPPRAVWTPPVDGPSPYEEWLRVNRSNPRSQLDLRRAVEAVGSRAPAFSVIMPVYRPELWMLRDAIESVRAQTIDTWELCIVDDGGGLEEVWAYLKDLARRDARIRVQRHDVNQGISEATNTAAASAVNPVLVLLDQDDLLDPECLAELALYYADKPEADLVYSDHDKIDVEGRRSDPQFKPDWSPTLLLSYMYLGHVISVRRSVFEAVGGMRKAFDGAQDFDFALRACEHARHIGHIPRILYHWRAVEGSTALSGAAKPGSFDAGAEAVRQAFLRRGLETTVTRAPWAVARSIGVFHPEVSAPRSRFAVLMPDPGDHLTLARRMRALKDTQDADFEILIGADGTTGDEIDLATSILGARLRAVTVPRDAVPSKRLNLLAEVTDADRLVLLGREVEVTEASWLRRLSGYLDLPTVHIVGPRLCVAGRVVDAGRVFGTLANPEPPPAFAGLRDDDGGYMQLALVARDCRAIGAELVMIDTTHFRRIGGMNFTSFPDYLSFVDLCVRAAPVGGCVVCADVQVTTYAPAPSPGARISAQTAALHWPNEDPFHNRNLSRQGNLFRPFAIAPKRRTGAAVRTTFLSHNLRNEGAPRTLVDLVLALSGRGRIDADLVTLDDGPLVADLETANIPVTPVPAAAGDAPPSVEAEIAALVRHFHTAGTEVVFANTLRAFPAIVAAARAGLPSVMWQHESEPWETYFGDLEPGLRDETYRALQSTYRWTYVAEATRRAWAGLADRHNTMTIPHDLPYATRATTSAERQFSRADLGVTPQDVMILLPGTVCGRKGQRDAVRAMGRLDDATASRVKLFIVGAQPEADYVEALNRDLARLGRDRANRVFVTGPAPEMAPYYAAADIALCTSRIESAPRVILEAMSFGLPLISTPVFGIREMVWPDWNAIFYPPGKVALLAKAVRSLVADPDLRHRMGARGPDILAARRGFQAEVEEYEAILLEAALATPFSAPEKGDLLAPAT